MADGSYGTSDISGDPIPFARLRAVPWARHDTDEE
jgi:RNA polymerase-binding transcription factor DksA